MWETFVSSLNFPGKFIVKFFTPRKFSQGFTSVILNKLNIILNKYHQLPIRLIKDSIESSKKAFKAPNHLPHKLVR